MWTRIPLGRWAHIRVDAHWSTLVTIAFIAEIMAMSVLPAAAPGFSWAWYWGIGAVVGLLFLLALLAHELAHAVVARHYKVEVDGITLWMLGGMTRFTSELPSARAELVVSVIGPFTSLVAGGFFAGLLYACGALGAPALVLGALAWLALMNGILCVFNLLPGAPLDGGRVLHALVWRRTGDRARATMIASRVGAVVGVLFIGFGLIEMITLNLLAGLWLMLIGWFMMAASGAEASSANVRATASDIRVRDVMVTDPVTAPGWLTVDGFLERVGWSAHQRVFPVIDFALRPSGVVSLFDLQRLSPQERIVSRVSDVCRSLDRVPVFAPGDPLTKLLTARLRDGRDLALVIEEGQLVGVVGTNDIARALELATLQRPSVREPLTPGRR